jgi:predicted branched-subunit amino acid permease
MSTFNSSSDSVASQQSSGAEFRRGIKESLPVLIGFLPIALVLGAQATARGFTAWQVPLMCGANFAGGSEFVAVGLWAVPPDLVLIAAMTLLVNSRHLLMGAALAPLARHLPGRKIFPALFVMCDESWAMGLADARKRGLFSLPYYLGTSIGMWVTWVLFTYAGASAIWPPSVSIWPSPPSSWCCCAAPGPVFVPSAPGSSVWPWRRRPT